MNHEQSLADEFNKFAIECAEEAGFTINSFSLDGQDRDAGADYVITNTDSFSLIEFKDTEKQFKSELKKSRRLNLCEKLEETPKMEKLHDNCHFIAWADSFTGSVSTNIYRNEICNKTIFGENAQLSCINADPTTRMKAHEFTSEFISENSKNNLSLEQFELYLSWLMKETSNSQSSTLELVTRKPNVNELNLIKLSSIREAHDWLKAHKMKPKKKRKLKF
ncbi:hypothetical protein [Pseudoalteromonas spongiae]|uniref:hypothetical protein n=1 Tax=Pseudoalteromonas spongiae TaxID=298657 RepID=UPI0037360A59